MFDKKIKKFVDNVHSVRKFSQKALLKPCMDTNTKLIIRANKEFKKTFFRVMNNSVFGKSMKNVRTYRDIKLVTPEKTRNKLPHQSPIIIQQNTFCKSY